MTAQDGGAGALPEIRVPAALSFAGLLAGLAVGIAVRGTALEAPMLGFAQPVGALWLQALKMTIVPLVAGLLFTGVMQTVATASAGRMARRTLGLFLAVLAFSAATGIVVTPALLEWSPVPSGAVAVLGGTGDVETGSVPSFADFLTSLLPSNAIDAAAQGAMLPFVLFVTLFALAATRLGPVHRDTLARVFEALAGAMMVMIGWVLFVGPVGVFALALGLGAGSGMAAIGALAHYIVIVVLTGTVILIASYALGILGARHGPLRFARAMLPANAVALSTQSSLASLPAMLAGARSLGVSPTTSETVLPLSVALFRATSPAMNLAVAIYAAHLTGVALHPAALIAGAGVALLVSLSSVSLPGTLSFVASVGPIAVAMGVPLEPLAVLVAVEMLPDLMRTLGNVTADVAVTATVDRGTGLPAPAGDQK